jgi:hypothetical protein
MNESKNFWKDNFKDGPPCQDCAVRSTCKRDQGEKFDPLYCDLPEKYMAWKMRQFIKYLKKVKDSDYAEKAADLIKEAQSIEKKIKSQVTTMKAAQKKRNALEEQIRALKARLS